jgi:hypothetical protein
MMIMMIVVVMMIVMIVVHGFVVMFVVMIEVAAGMVLVVSVPVTVSVPIVQFLQQAHRIQEGNTESEKQELGQPKPKRSFFVQNVRQYVHGGQIHKAPRGDKDQAVSRHVLRQEPHRGANHSGKGGPELRHDGFLLAESVFNENGKIPQLVGYFVEQYRKRRQTTPCFHNVQYASATRKVRKRGSDGNSIRELEMRTTNDSLVLVFKKLVSVHIFTVYWIFFSLAKLVGQMPHSVRFRSAKIPISSL